MISLFSRIFIRERKNFSSPAVRKAYGLICSITGILLNFLLFFFKLAAGSVSGSVAVTVDAFHNLTDMGSSVVTFISFVVSGQKKSKKYPFGKGRAEYIAGFIIAIVLITAGIQLAKTSILKIITPEPVTFSVFSVAILIVSILVKIYMSRFNKYYGIKIDSAALKAASLDCLCDSIATVIAAAAIVFSKFTDFNLDAFGGLAVSLFILYAGCKAAKDAIDMIMGAAPSEGLCNKLVSILGMFPEILRAENLAIHDYGPDNKIITLNIFVSGSLTFTRSHEISDALTEKIKSETSCEAVVKMIPINN